MELSTTVGLERVLFACRAGWAGAAGAYLARTSYVDRPSRGSKASLPKSLWRTRSRQREAAARIGIGIIVVVALAPTVVLTKSLRLGRPGYASRCCTLPRIRDNTSWYCTPEALECRRCNDTSICVDSCPRRCTDKSLPTICSRPYMRQRRPGSRHTFS
jgi:hypothetical protein